MKEQVLLQKQDLVSEIREKFDNSASAVVVEYRGLSVAQVTQLRRDLLSEGVDLKVYKNTMTRRAIEGKGYDELLESLKGPNAIAFSSDAVAPARVLAKFAKTNQHLVLKQAVVEGKVISVEEVKEISKLPNREGMLSMLLGCLQSPMRNFAWAIKQLSEKDADENTASAVVENVDAAKEVAESVVAE